MEGCKPDTLGDEICRFMRNSGLKLDFMYLDAPAKKQLALGAEFVDLPQLTGESTTGGVYGSLTYRASDPALDRIVYDRPSSRALATSSTRSRRWSGSPPER